MYLRIVSRNLSNAGKDDLPEMEVKDDSSFDSKKLAYIVPAVVIGCALIVVSYFLIYWFCCMKSRDDEDAENAENAENRYRSNGTGEGGPYATVEPNATTSNDSSPQDDGGCCSGCDCDCGSCDCSC